LIRTEALATEIFNDCGNEPLICLCVLKGGYKFFADLTERIQNRNRTNGNKSLPMMIDFIRLKSYHVSFQIAKIIKIKFEIKC
jgi:hypoxanthine phosphoribosyltransferase